MVDPELLVDEALAVTHGLKPEEYQRFRALIGRTPTFTELGIVSAMWNEHCSYKSSRLHLRRLPTRAPWVIQGPGENAGVIAIGDGEACVFKMESHNHPSFIEPYQGAATGVGGILRDVFTMGARPVACLNLLRFGSPEHPKTRRLVAGVVAGIGHYGNAFGVPTVGGSVGFHRRYDGNILVNAMAVGVARADAIFYAKATGVGNPIVYLGSKTGRDGIHGATMASAAFEADAEEKRPTVQVGDPFAEKLLLEACLELMASGAVVAIQDMGAAGLTSSAVEMGAKGDLGVELDLDLVPCRERGMTAYEMMLSESQERMLMVLHPEKADEARAIFRKWGLDFAVIGRTTDSKRFVIKHRGVVEADLPIKELGDEAPLYDRPWIATPQRAPLEAASVTPSLSIRDALLALLGSPDLCCKRWVYEQYDSLILGNTVVGPGGDAALVRLGEGPKGLAFTTDVTERYCEADPVEGGKQAVAEAWRNLVCVGARPLALTDNLNFGNPEKAAAMGQFVGCLQGIGDAAGALDFPIVSGNVSLYNETMGVGILPTPAIGGVGLNPDVKRTARAAFRREGDVVLLIGGAPGWIGCSAWLATCEDRDEGAPPPVDLAAERRHGEFVLGLIQSGALDSVHDVSDGGLAVALAEMAINGGIGARIAADAVHGQPHAFFFGEDQARYVAAAPRETAERIVAEAANAGVPALELGETGGASLDLPGEAPLAIAELRAVFESWFPAYMEGSKP
ncbi:MAG: phosphoribosylformylglycinamidine synthase subunit PurL [Roseiarcus sp.]